jgi:hypothetical protein
MNTRDDWYRKETWSAADAAEFERRLSRSRGQRTQYLKLQAWHLAQTKKPSLADAAILLANRYLAEEPNGFFEVEAHLITAEAKTTLQDFPGALQAYRCAVKAETRKRGRRCCAYLAYAWFAASNGLSEEFDDVLKSMESMEQADLVFPMSQYKYFGALALISAEMQDCENARHMARNALEAAIKSAPFRRHRAVGIVSGIDSVIQKRISQLAA